MKKLLVLTVAAAAALSSACGTLTPWAARVNGALVTRSGLDNELHTVLHNKAYLQEVDAQLAQQGARVEGNGTGTIDTAFAARALTRRILLLLVHQEVTRRHLKLTAADLTQATTTVAGGFQDPKVFQSFPKSYRDEIVRSSAEVDLLQRSLVSGGTSDAALRRYYDAHQAEFTETCVSHILVADQAKAAALKAQITGGADFATLAKANSTDNQGPTGGSAAKGGDLGCLSDLEEQSLDPAFKAGMDALAVGQVSDPVQSQFGFHIIKVTARRQRAFADARQDIQTRISQQANTTFTTLLQALVARAKIEVNPRYGHFDKGANFGVVPPVSPSVVTTTTQPVPVGSGIPGQ